MAVNTGSFQAPKPAPVHFTEAIEFLRAKTRVGTRAYTDIWRDQHSRAFMVAGAMKDGLVADFHEAVTKAIAEGRTIADFRKDFDRIVADHGWSYKGGREWRSRTIFETNMRSAYGAGRWAQAVRLKKTRPYLRYVHGHPLHPRLHHLAWDGIILPVDHPWWRTHFAPNGWGCQCLVQSVSEAEMKRNGWKVTDDADLPPVNLIRHELNTPDGPKEIFVPEGIDPGFDYNPGEGAFGRGANLTEAERHGDFKPLEAPSSMRAEAGPLEPVPAMASPAKPVQPVDGKPDEPAMRGLLRDAIGGDEAIFVDPTGMHISVTQGVADHLIANPSPQNVARASYWPLIPELIESPQEIWVGFEKDQVSGKVRLRRRYVKFVRVSKDRVVALVADEQNGFWQALTFFAGRAGTQLNNLRQGVRVFPES